MPNKIRQACVLVGGKGTRLGALTQSMPKPLLEVNENLPFIEILLDQLSRQGFSDIILLAGHLGEVVKERYHGRALGEARIRVVVEPAPRGTGGALLTAKDILAPRFLLLNGDSFFDVNLRAFANEPAAENMEALIALRQVPDASPYGAVDLEGHRIVRFREKSAEIRGKAVINAGVCMLTSHIVERIQTLPCSLETELFPVLAAERLLAGVVYDRYFLDIGRPETLTQGRQELTAFWRRPAAFLDRDGVLFRDSGYVHRPEQVEWVPGAMEAVRYLNDSGFRVIVVTNQAGVGHGFYDETDVHALHRWLQDELAAHGAYIDAFYHSPYHPEARVEKYRMQHIDRKPSPGMILRAFQNHAIDKRRSFMIGDQASDIEAARAAGIPGYFFDESNLAMFIKARLAVPPLDERTPRLEDGVMQK